MTLNKKIKNTVVICAFCKKDNVTYNSPDVKDDTFIRKEQYSLKCNECGSTGVISEYWIRKIGEPHEHI